MINDGFVSGANTKDASAALQNGGCTPQPSKHDLKITLHTIFKRAPCATDDALCSAAAAVASEGSRSVNGEPSERPLPPELAVVMAAQADVEALRVLLQTARRASVTNLLVVVPSQDVLDSLGDDCCQGGPRTLLYKPAEDDGTPLGAVLARHAVVGHLLSLGFGVLSASPATVFISNPFRALYRDSDIEVRNTPPHIRPCLTSACFALAASALHAAPLTLGHARRPSDRRQVMSSGWDDGSAYGYNHVLDDPSMGFTRFCHGSRIVAYEPGFFFAMPTREAVALTSRLRAQLKTPARVDPAATMSVVGAAEREILLHELWLPSHHDRSSRRSAPCTV